MKREFLFLAFAGVLLVALYANVFPRRKPASTAQPIVALSAPAEINKFHEPVKFEVMDSLTKKRLMDATLQTCVASYHRESCVYYLLVCGSTCKELVSPETFKRARSDYWTLAQAYGIKPSSK